MFHSHGPWEVVSRTYVPPAAPTGSIKGASEYVFLRFVYGFTNITQRCTKCGKLEVTSCYGKATTE